MPSYRYGGICEGGSYWHKFRRQEPICEFIVDFVCREAMVIVEIDGAYHEETANRDRERADVLEAGGYAVVRFTNAEVLTGVSRCWNQFARLSPLGWRLSPTPQCPHPALRADLSHRER